MSDWNYTQGIPFRDYVAAHVLAGLVACSKTSGTFEAFSRDAVRYADALIEELSAKSTTEESTHA